jgi:hypothetical protein
MSLKTFAASRLVAHLCRERFTAVEKGEAGGWDEGVLDPRSANGSQGDEVLRSGNGHEALGWRHEATDVSQELELAASPGGGQPVRSFFHARLQLGACPKLARPAARMPCECQRHGLPAFMPGWP